LKKAICIFFLIAWNVTYVIASPPPKILTNVPPGAPIPPEMPTPSEPSPLQITYKVVVTVLDIAGNPIENMWVGIYNTTNYVIGFYTNSSGIVELDVEPGTYKIHCGGPYTTTPREGYYLIKDVIVNADTDITISASDMWLNGELSFHIVTLSDTSEVLANHIVYLCTGPMKAPVEMPVTDPSGQVQIYTSKTTYDVWCYGGEPTKSYIAKIGSYDWTSDVDLTVNLDLPP